MKSLIVTVVFLLSTCHAFADTTSISGYANGSNFDIQVSKVKSVAVISGYANGHSIDLKVSKGSSSTTIVGYANGNNIDLKISGETDLVRSDVGALLNFPIALKF